MDLWNWLAKHRVACGGWILAAAAIGCDREPAPSGLPVQQLPALEALGAPPGQAIVAQGQLRPAAGVLPITAPPGDRVESILVSVGERVTEGQVLGRLVSQEAREAELAVAESRLAEAKTQTRAEQTVAEAQLEVARTGLRSAELQARQAVEQLQTAEAEGGRLHLLEQRLELAEERLAQLREASGDPATGRLVTPSKLRQQQLEVDQARAEIAEARRNAEAAIETGRLQVERAQQEIRQAELAIEAAGTAVPLASLEKQIELLQLQVEATELISPIDGVVLSIDIGAGEPTTGRPIMRLADTSRMICDAEVNVAQLPRLRIGAEARLTSAALARPLAGEVTSISRIVGPPSLENPNPLAQADYRTVEVVIEVAPEDTEAAAQLIQLQVDVAIRAAEATAESP